MKKLLLLPIILALLAALILGGCASQPSAPPQTQAPPATSAPAQTAAPTQAAGQTKILKFAYDMPATSPITPGWYWFADELQKRTNGQVKIDFYAGQSLFKSAEAINSILAGVTDIGAATINANQKVFANNRMLTLPSVFFPDTAAGHTARRAAAAEMYAKYPALSNELSKFKLLFWQTNPAYTVISKNKKVVVPDDLKGLKVASLGLDMEIVKSCGGSPVPIVPPDVYMNMDKGVIDSALVGWFMVKNEHFEEIAQYWLDYGFGQNTQLILMNQASWNALSPDVQKIFTDLAAEVESRSDVSYLAAVEEGRKIVQAKGREITALTPEQRQLWSNAVQPMDQVWVDQAKAAGVANAQEMLDSFKALCAQAWK